MKIYAVRNWDRFQHYKTENGKPTWIKLYRDLLRDHVFMMLPERERWIVVGLWIVAAETGNRIPGDAAYLKASLNLSRAPDLAKYEGLGFIEELDAV